MPDAGRQIWEVRVPRNVELTPLENKNEQEQNKIIGKKEAKKKWRMKKWWKKEMNKKTMKNDLSKNDPWLRLPWNTIWAYLSFLSKP